MAIRVQKEKETSAWDDFKDWYKNLPKRRPRPLQQEDVFPNSR